MLDLFRQATKDALALLGESALLRATEPCQVNIERGVQLSGMDTDFESSRESRVFATTRDVATIAGEFNPRVGDTLRVGAYAIDGTIPVGQNYKLDVPLEDVGAFRRFVLLAV
jgi:hypothetical protein